VLYTIQILEVISSTVIRMYKIIIIDFFYASHNLLYVGMEPVIILAVVNGRPTS